MRSNSRSYRLATIGLAALATGLLPPRTANAAVYFLDLNGTTSGFGVANGGSYDWTSGTPWTTDGTGALAVAGIAWPGGSNQAYLIGAGASTNYTVRLGSTGASNITLQNFAINLNSTATGANGLGDVTIGNAGDTGVLTLNAGNSFGAQGGGKLTVNNPISLAAVSANFRGGTVVLNGVISSANSSGTLTLGNTGGTFGLPTTGGVLRLGNTANTFTGKTTIGEGFTLEVTTVASAGTANSLGNSTNIASNLQIDGTLRYVGVGGNTNRGMQFNGDGGTIEASGSGALNLNTLSTIPIAFDGSASSKTVTLGGTNVSSGNIFGGALGDNTVSSVVYPTALVKNDAGTWTINNASNSFTGNVTINAGTLRVGNTGALGVGPKNLFMQGGSRILQLSNGTILGPNITLTVATNSADGSGISSVDSVNALQGPINISTGLGSLNISSLGTSTLTIAGNVTQTTTGRTLYLGGSSTNQNTVSGTIREATGTGSLPVIKQGVGTWVLTGANTYTGGTTVNGGTLTVGTGGTLGDSTGPLAVNNLNTGAGTAVTLNLPIAADVVVGSLSGSIATPSSGTNTATINTQSGRVITVNQTADANFAGTIAGECGLTLGSLSTKTLKLSGTNSYAAGTNINAGTLLADGATSALGTGTTAVNGGVLAGNGATGGPVNVSANGTISAGDGASRRPNGGVGTGGTAGKLASGAQTWSPGATGVFKIASATGTAGLSTGYDQLSMSSLSLSVNSNGAYNIVLTNAANSAFTALADGTTLTIIRTMNGIYFGPTNVPVANNTDLSNLFVLDTSDLGISGQGFTITASGSAGGPQDLLLSYNSANAAPEPGSVLLTAMGSSPLLLRRRSRRRIV